MTRVELRNIKKSFGETKVLDGVDLTIESGSFCVFVGPSGCGKSTLLRIIAGLEQATEGDVLFDGKSVSALEPAQREIAMVFQSYALYPHMTVRDNLAFGLKLRNAPAAEMDAAVLRAAKMLDIEHLLARRHRELSGGQRQRVAIGRAIVRKPKVFLFDEPLSNLDAELRGRMRYELAQLHQSLGATMIYVTHDQVEAMTLADNIVVLSNGHVEQVGPPLKLYEAPANLFVAKFIGSPPMNCLDGKVKAIEGDCVTLEVDGASPIQAAAKDPRAKVGDAVTIGIRPQALQAGAGPNQIEATVTHVERLGGDTLAYFMSPASSEPQIARLPGDAQIGRGEKLTLHAAPAEVLLFHVDGAAFQRP